MIFTSTIRANTVVFIVLFVVIKIIYEYNVVVDWNYNRNIKQPNNNVAVLLQLQQQNFERSVNCIARNIKNNSSKASFLLLKSAINFKTNQTVKDVEDHYLELLNKTQRLRSEHSHRINGIRGDWLEQHWIRLCKFPLLSFGGFVPIFVQWADFYVHYHDAKYDYRLLDKLVPLLRKDVVYVTVSSSAAGILGHSEKYSIENDLWNVLVLSAGGVGHVPIPLLGVDQRFDTELNEKIMKMNSQEKKTRGKLMMDQGVFHYTQSFVGWIRNIRNEMNQLTLAFANNSITNKDKSFSYLRYYGENWTSVLEKTMINLAPRGYGRTSFRVAEIIQRGYLFLYIYSDLSWSVYDGSNCSYESIGYSVNISDYSSWLTTRQWNLTVEEYLEKKKRIVACRDSHYTYDGVMNQIWLFLNEPRKSDLVCKT